MSKKISPTLIGAFVCGALALLVAAVVVLGSGRLFRHTREFVLYFDSSVNGLRVGAPVKFKGVEIGAVKNIVLQLGQDLNVTKIPVIIEVDLDKLTARGVQGSIMEDMEGFRQAMIQRGLRGQLLMESLVTGLLYVGLDFFPGTPVVLVQRPDAKNTYQEIPTTATTLEQAQDAATRIIAKLEELDFKGVLTSLSASIDGINKLVNAPELKDSLRSLAQTMPKIDEAVSGVQKAVTTIDGGMEKLTDNLGRTSDATREALQQIEVTLKQTDGTLKATEAAMVNVRSISDPDAATFYEIARSLREVSAAARSLRLLADSIERNPRALIFGKPDSRAK
jgi:paraquat-inducible protein B